MHDVYSICTYSVELESLGAAAGPLTMSLGDGVVCHLPVRSREAVANEAQEGPHSDGSVREGDGAVPKGRHRDVRRRKLPVDVTREAQRQLGHWYVTGQRGLNGAVRRSHRHPPAGSTEVPANERHAAENCLGRRLLEECTNLSCKAD